MKTRKYYIVSVNCDCCSYLNAYTLIGWKVGPRCFSCGRVVGPISWSVVGEVEAASQFDAVTAYYLSRRK